MKIKERENVVEEEEEGSPGNSVLQEAGSVYRGDPGQRQVK